MLNGILNLVSGTDATVVQAGGLRGLLRELFNFGGATGDFPASLTTTASSPVTLGGVIFKSFASLNSPTGAAPQLKNVTIPGGTLSATTGSMLRVRGWGSLANNANAKSVLLKFGATTVITVACTASVANLWHIDAVIGVRSATTQITSAIGAQGTGTPTHVEADGTAGETLSGDIVLQFTGVQTSAADIIQDGMLVEWIA